MFLGILVQLENLPGANLILLETFMKNFDIHIPHFSFGLSPEITSLDMTLVPQLLSYCENPLLVGDGKSRLWFALFSLNSI